MRCCSKLTARIRVFSSCRNVYKIHIAGKQEPLSACKGCASNWLEPAGRKGCNLIKEKTVHEKTLAKQVRKQLIIPAEMDQRLTSIAEDSGTTASEIVRKAITLYIAATEKKRQGLKLGFARPEQTLETEVIGL